ncbi:touch receptor neuron protein Mec-17-domain-containing protein [Blastocladiella britannica]|nr:touch receptor neuron protein Mec-17-domain-containing protein [Blastocladiella britannica]
MDISAPLFRRLTSRTVVSGEPTIVVLDASNLVPLSAQLFADREVFSQLELLLDQLGERSAIAQGLKTPITSVRKLRESDHRAYLLLSGQPSSNGRSSRSPKLLGYVKVGAKKLFIPGPNGRLQESIPLCVLDFYVCESVQRVGHGLHLFESMLKNEMADPSDLAYDRPSTKMRAFLRKSFGLVPLPPLPTNFVQFVPCDNDTLVAKPHHRAAAGVVPVAAGIPTTPPRVRSGRTFVQAASPDPITGQDRIAITASAIPPTQGRHRHHNDGLPALGTRSSGSGSNVTTMSSGHTTGSLPSMPRGLAVGHSGQRSGERAEALHSSSQASSRLPPLLPAGSSRSQSRHMGSHSLTSLRPGPLMDHRTGDHQTTATRARSSAESMCSQEMPSTRTSILPHLSMSAADLGGVKRSRGPQ